MAPRPIPPVRFDHQVGSPFDDGWDTLTGEFTELPRLATTLTRATPAGPRSRLEHLT